MKPFWMAAPICLLAAAGCGEAQNAQALTEASLTSETESPAAAPVCQVDGEPETLPDDVRETSGLAQSLTDAGLFWTHNDAGNGAEIIAFRSDGSVAGRVAVSGAEAEDWEDVEAARCAEGACLFIGDIGDNDADREWITIYRIPEPASGASTSEPAVALHARFPDGAQDSEALFVLPSGDIFVVTKGRRGPIALYRYPAPQQEGETVTLERVRELFPEPENDDGRVTGATASPDGRWVGIRTYRELYLYPADALLGNGALTPAVVDLSPLGESQGESVAIGPDGSVWLTSEAENGDDRPTWARLRCNLTP